MALAAPTGRLAKAQALEIAVLPAASAAQRPRTVVPAASPTLELAVTAQATSQQTELAAPMERLAKPQALGTAALPAASAAPIPTTAVPGVSQLLVPATQTPVPSRQMASVVLTGRHARGQPLATAALLVVSAASARITAALDANRALDPATRAPAIFLRMVNAVPTARPAKARLLVTVARLAAFVALIRVTAARGARQALAPVILVLAISPRMASVAPMARLAKGPLSEIAVLPAAFAEQTRVTVGPVVRRVSAPAIPVPVIFPRMANAVPTVRPARGRPLEPVVPLVTSAAVRLHIVELDARQALARVALAPAAFRQTETADRKTARRASTQPLVPVVRLQESAETPPPTAVRDGEYSTILCVGVGVDGG